MTPSGTGVEVAAHNEEMHHAAPRCLLRLHDEANGSLRMAGGVGAWLEWTDEAGRWGVEVTISREDLEALIERSTEILDWEKHRLLHESDWRRWGRRGGLATLRKYGTDWYAALALRRWGRLTADDLEAMRPVR